MTTEELMRRLTILQAAARGLGTELKAAREAAAEENNRLRAALVAVTEGLKDARNFIRDTAGEEDRSMIIAVIDAAIERAKGGARD